MPIVRAAQLGLSETDLSRVARLFGLQRLRPLGGFENVLLASVAIHELSAPGEGDRGDPLAHETLPPGQQIQRRVVGERLVLKGEELAHVQRTGLVLGEEPLVLPLMGDRVHCADAHQELAPQVVAVPAEQGVVQVEQRDPHGLPRGRSSEAGA